MIKPMYFEPIFDFSLWLNEVMEERGISMTVLSHMSGVSKNSIQGYCSAKHEPSYIAAYSIANALGYTIGVVPSKHVATKPQNTKGD